jgi:Arc/MetJ-type ribon-helix-helix transcriptional regulator
MVYSDVVARTQIYLGEEELGFLDEAASATGASRSELIRRAVRRTYGTGTRADRINALKASAGSWHGRSFTGAEYVDAIRGDLEGRLRQFRLR